jgi:16S rRNA (guanine1207-N2)-methyltransferase
MADHYYTSNPNSAHHERQIEAVLRGQTMRFYTDAGVFSKDEVDPGSRLLIESADSLSGRVLDMGCGWGPVGLSLALANPDAQIVMADINERAAELSERNRRLNGVENAQIIVSNGFEGVDGEFDHVFTNPPIRAGKQTIYAMFDESFRRLHINGTLNIVIRKQQGAPSAKKHLEEVFGNASVIAKSAGYWIIRCTKQ